MIRVVKYSRGKVTNSSLKNINLLRDIVWIDTFGGKEELKEIGRKFNLYQRDLEDSVDMEEIPRISNRKDYSFIVLRSLADKDRSVPIGIFISKRFIITVHPKEIVPLSKFFKVVSSKEGKEFFRNGVDYLFYKVASEINRNLHGDIDKFDDKLDKLEDRVLKDKFENIDEIFPLKKHLAYYKRAISLNRGIIEKLQNKTCKFISEKNYVYLNELHVETVQAESMVEFQREKLRGILDMHMSVVSNRLNDIMRSFTVLASLFLFPAIIAGIWGMNFAKIPFYSLEWGFYVPLGIMIIGMGILFIFFKYKKWV